MPMRTNNSMTTTASIITTETSTTSKGAVAAAALPPPPGMTLSTATSTAHHSNSNNSFMTNGAGFIRRVSSVDDDHMNSGGGVRYHMYRDALHHHPDGNDNNIHNNIRPISTNSAASAPTQPSSSSSSPWREDIFRSTDYGRDGGEVKQSRNESSQRATHSDPLSSSSSLLFLQQQGVMVGEVGNGASNRPLLDDESSLDEMRASCPNNQDRPLEVYGRATGSSGAISATGGSFDQNDNNGSTNIFRSHPKRLYSPVIGTPTRNSMVGRKRLDTDWTMFRANSNDHLFSGTGDNNWNNNSTNDAGALSSSSTTWIPSIRPSLSCPTSVFESPLFSSSLNSLGGVGSSSHHSSFGIGGSNSTGGCGRGSMGADTILLSQPYRLEKIESISAEASPAHALLDNSGNFLGDDNKSDDDDEVNTSADKVGNELENVDVSVIECEDYEDSPFRNAAKSTMTSTSTTTNHLSHHPHSLADHNDNSNNMVGGDNPRLVVNANPMRNLSDAFESLVVDNSTNYNYSGGNYVHGNHQTLSDPDNISTRMQSQFVDLSSRVGASASISSLPQHSQIISETTSGANINNTTTTSLADALSKNGETGSSTKPSPTSVFSFVNEKIPNPSTHQFANGLTVVSISMPRFHLHAKLRGNLRQGLIDRVSFYSIVRDINKEALDAAMTDPKGGIYNDGTVHGKLRQMKRMGDSQSDNAGSNVVTDVTLKRVEDAADDVQDIMTKNPSPSTIAGTHQVIAEDGKIHLHPNPQEERESLLVMACLPDEQGVEEDQCPTSTSINAPKAASPSLGAALLDEEWWLMSAIASRAPEEVAINQSTQLLVTFYEAMGEKESSANATDGNNTNSASSRTQLWKPGRSWWEAKSGKNPWVEPVVHNNRWRYLWPLIHYHKFMAKCIKKLKRNGVDVKTSTSDVSLFLREEVCNVSDHLAFMSKYDSEEWTSALSHFDGWTDHDSNVEETLRTLVASQQLAGLAETVDFQSSLLLSQIDDKILKAMQAAKDDAGKDKYDYKDAPHQHVEKKAESSKAAVDEGGLNVSSHSHPHSAQDNSSFGSSIKSGGWTNETHLRMAIESKKRAGIPKNLSNRPEYPLRHPYPHPDTYSRQLQQHASYGHPYGHTFAGSLNSSYYHASDPHQYSGFAQYPPLPLYHMDYHHHGDMLYNTQYGHRHQYGNGYYHPADGSFQDGMSFDTSFHTQDHYSISASVAQTPNRYNGSEMHNGQYPASPYWSHLNISQLPGIASSPSFHMPSRGNHPNRSFRKRNHQQGYQQGKTDSDIDGKAKSLIMFPNQTNSPASRFVMSPQDKKSNPYYTAKNSHARNMASNDERSAPQSASKLNHSAGADESFVLPTIEDYPPESPKEKAVGYNCNTSLDMMPPAVKKMYTGSLSPRRNIE